MGLSVSVVIRCFNEEAHIGRLLSGIVQQREVDVEIVVVDSGSTDRTLEVVSGYPDVRVAHIDPSAFSFGRALNLGFALASNEIVVAASAHVYPQRNDWLCRLARPFREPAVCLVYGRQLGDDRSAFSERQLFRRWFPETSDPAQSHPFCNNANAAVRRSVWEKLKYDEELTGLEDLDWAKRAMAAGHAVSYASDAAVVHVHQQSWRQVLHRYRREAIAHRRIYNEQRLSRTEAVVLGVGNICGDLLAAAREGSLRRHSRDIVLFRSAQFLGTYRGFAQDGAIPADLKRRFYYPAGFRSGVSGTAGDPEEAVISYGATGDYDILGQPVVR